MFSSDTPFIAHSLAVNGMECLNTPQSCAQEQSMLTSSSSDVEQDECLVSPFSPRTKIGSAAAEVLCAL